MGVEPSGLKINGARVTLSSCSSKGVLNFSWRLIAADDDVIDYVVVHELAHIIEKNHSLRFWRIVEDVLPDYEMRKKGLRVLRQRLALEEKEGYV